MTHKSQAPDFKLDNLTEIEKRSYQQNLKNGVPTKGSLRDLREAIGTRLNIIYEIADNLPMEEARKLLDKLVNVAVTEKEKLS